MIPRTSHTPQPRDRRRALRVQAKALAATAKRRDQHRCNRRSNTLLPRLPGGLRGTPAISLRLAETPTITTRRVTSSRPSAILLRPIPSALRLRLQEHLLRTKAQGHMKEPLLATIQLREMIPLTAGKIGRGGLKA